MYANTVEKRLCRTAKETGFRGSETKRPMNTYKVSVWTLNDKEISAEFNDIETAELFFEGFKIGGAFKRVSFFEDGNIIREWKNDRIHN